MNRNIRWILLVAGLIALYFGGRALGLDRYLHESSLREAVASAGPLGPLLFLAVFIGAVLAQIPGIPFVILAPALFHWPMAIFLSLLAANVAVIVNFEIVRRIGGNTLTEIKNPFLQRILDSLDTHPIRAVFLLRLITIMLPPITGALALTRVSRRDHAVGSALGMIVPLLALLAAGGMLVTGS
jgi:uncharacterized membrane protein YdjX (TVP38/TMEM64 family)